MFIFTVVSLHLQTFRVFVFAWCIHPYVSFYTSMCDCGFFVTCGCVFMCAHMHWLPPQHWVASCLFLSKLLVISSMFIPFIFRLWNKTIGTKWSVFKTWTSVFQRGQWTMMGNTWSLVCALCADSSAFSEFYFLWFTPTVYWSLYFSFLRGMVNSKNKIYRLAEKWIILNYQIIFKMW